MIQNTITYYDLTDIYGEQVVLDVWRGQWFCAVCSLHVLTGVLPVLIIDVQSDYPVSPVLEVLFYEYREKGFICEY